MSCAASGRNQKVPYPIPFPSLQGEIFWFIRAARALCDLSRPTCWRLARRLRAGPLSISRSSPPSSPALFCHSNKASLSLHIEIKKWGYVIKPYANL